jgi:hypothetical protein
VQAQTEGNNTLQGNLNTDNNINTLANKTANVNEGSAGGVRWVTVNENETIFNIPPKTTLSSGNYTRINGIFYLNLTDLTQRDVNKSGATPKAEFNFTDPTGKTKYGVILKNISSVAEYILVDDFFYGNSSTESFMEPVVNTYSAVWGVGEFYVNGTLVNDNRLIRVMASERVNSSDNEGYKLLSDKELPQKGLETRLFLPDLVIAKNGTVDKQPVPTNVTLPDGKNQSFINVVFENSRLEGHRIFLNNTSENMTGI